MRSVLIVAMLMVACGPKPSTVETTSTWILPEGLTDCRVYSMDSSKGASMRVMRCPNSSTFVR